VLTRLLNAYISSLPGEISLLPMEIKMTVEYTGYKQVKRNVELSSEMITDVRIRENASK